MVALSTSSDFIGKSLSPSFREFFITLYLYISSNVVGVQVLVALSNIHGPILRKDKVTGRS